MDWVYICLQPLKKAGKKSNILQFADALFKCRILNLKRP